ncbi:DUF5959 family protein [Actinomadura miaoliensis]|uniref:Uncharacterized protein n=1 Tax=Actinomadura miaoliensis TaxID=430685 RepID=A0ABP7W1E6_9ACTN
MTHADLPDLIHLADDIGNSLVLRVTELDPEGLTGEIELASPFVNGRIRTRVSPEDLAEWETVLGDLERGDNTAWREGGRAIELWLEWDDHDRLVVSTIDDDSRVTVELTIDVDESWLDDHYKRLDTLQKLQSA